MLPDTPTAPITPNADATSPTGHRRGLRDDVAHLRERVGGRLSLPDDPDWDTIRRAWNLAVDQQPIGVLHARDAADVRTAVRWAASHSVAVTAQPTGHGALSPLDDVLVVRTGALDTIEVDLEDRTATVGAGVRTGELLRALDGTGTVFLAASSAGPSVVGSTLTGGISWFGRRFGIGANSVVAVEIVDGRGEHRRITADDPESFFALRGAGGDFGIVTRLQLALHPAPRVIGGRMMWPAERMRCVLRAFRRVTVAAPPELTVWFQVVQFGAADDVATSFRGRTYVIAAYALLGDAETAAHLLAPFSTIDDCLLDTTGPLAPSGLGTLADDLLDPSPVVQRGRLLHTVDDAFVTNMVDQLAVPSPVSMVQIRHLGGAFAERVDGHGAFAPVVEPYQLVALGRVPDPDSRRDVDAALDRLVGSVEPWSSGRSLLAFLGPDSTDRWWDPVTRRRLVAAKRRIDPLGIIRSNRPVERR